MIKAVFFDVDFTLIRPGPTFQAEGYRRACAARGVEIDPAKFDAATAASSFILDEVEEQIYNHDIFIHYTASIIEHMGGRGPEVPHVAAHIYEQWATNHHFEMYDDVAPVLTELVAREIYEQWSVNQHFEIYDDVAPVLTELQRRGHIVGVISNSHRRLDAFAEHFSLRNIITVSVSGFEHGYMKPHRSIFDAALERAEVGPRDAMMVGDSLAHDISGAINAGWSAVLLRRSGERPPGAPEDLTVITSLTELPDLLS